MPVREQPWPPGTPAWAELSTPDRERSGQFYAAVLGWEFTEPDTKLGNYLNALVGGLPVAGLAPQLGGADDPPPSWRTYLAVSDAADGVAEVLAAGGHLVMPAVEIAEFGSMALVAEPSGALFGLWQAGEHQGFALTEEPGAVLWAEVQVDDLPAARQFFAAAFQMSFTDAGGGGLLFHPPGQRPGGGMVRSAPERAPHWLLTFMVTDADDAVRRVVEHGGATIAPPVDIPYGRWARVAGPDREEFGLLSRP